MAKRFLFRFPRALHFLVLASCTGIYSGHGAEQRVSSPDTTISVIVNDEGGLHYRIETDGKPFVQDSPLGLEF
ncbi:MAG: glycoside hydrolase family 97 N-terminal domain-containing protein [Candidatus Methylacidiphilales bacterium]|nr:glycoside hydrolase family 97 N-terminal domain-containing protein [Candidatus Methylacidiphilales bacterium]